MLCWHSRYNLGDEHGYDSDDCLRQLAFEADANLEEYVDRLENDVYHRLYDRAADNGCDTWSERSAYANRWIGPRIADRVDLALRDGYVILPLYLYDHSGITMSTGSFSCAWDSGQVGWIVCDKETVDKEFNGDWELAEKCLQLEVEVYDQYLTGDVYGFIVEEFDGDDWHEVDSCHGFYGSDVHKSGMAEYLPDDLVKSAENAEVEYPA
jgi:hypothetical protein